MKRAEIVLEGDFRETGIRASTASCANALGLVGLVRHTKDGGAEVVCEGRKDSIDELVGELQDYLRLADASVASVSHSEPRGAFESFSAVYRNNARGKEERLEAMKAGVTLLGIVNDVLHDVNDTLNNVADTLNNVADTLNNVADTLNNVADTLNNVADTLNNVAEGFHNVAEAFRGDGKELRRANDRPDDAEAVPREGFGRVRA